jgi:hypothetical protein
MSSIKFNYPEQHKGQYCQLHIASQGSNIISQEKEAYFLCTIARATIGLIVFKLSTMML